MPARFQMRGIRKRYGSTLALDGVDLELQPGEVHAVIGENGAGKSTLMKILAGAEVQDSGDMFCDGVPYAPGDPQHARRRGVAMVYQELTLAPHLSVEANLLLGAEPHRLGFLRGSVIREKARQVLDLIAHPDIQPQASIASLNPASRQLVEIARALLLDLRILILDEPTSSLGRSDVVRLFQLIRQMQARGVTVVYISHFLEEVREIADRFTVLRDGQAVSTGSIREVTLQHIIEKMVGRNVEEQYPRVPHQPGEPILSLEDVVGEKNPRGASFELRKGEILGIAGVIGAGRTELLRAIAGLDPIRRGNLRLVRIPSTDLRHLSVRQRIDRGIGMLSEDRASEGLAHIRSIADNLTYSRLDRHSFFGWLRDRKRMAEVDGWTRKLNVRCRDANQAVGQLSGGNQQKVALGRLLHQEAEILLLDEPTRGVDISSKAEIYRLMGMEAARGRSILFVSSYLPELFGVCDRLTVMVRGKLGPIRPIAEWTTEEIMAHATGMGDGEAENV